MKRSRAGFCSSGRRLGLSAYTSADTADDAAAADAVAAALSLNGTTEETGAEEDWYSRQLIGDREERQRQHGQPIETRVEQHACDDADEGCHGDEEQAWQP